MSTAAVGLFTHGRSEWQLSTAPQPLIWQAGVDAAFLGNLAALLVVAALTVWAYMALAGAADSPAMPSHRPRDGV